jgi:hypothetical protein
LLEVEFFHAELETSVANERVMQDFEFHSFYIIREDNIANCDRLGFLIAEVDVIPASFELVRVVDILI